MDSFDHQLPGAGTQAPRVGDALPAGTDRHVMSELAAGFAHELNQPLAAIAAYADGAALLLRRDASYVPEVINIIQAIAGQALRAGEVIQQLRGAARPLPRADLPLDLNALVRSVLPLLEALAARQAVRLSVELRTPVSSVLGDGPRLQALLILLFAEALDTVGRLPAERRHVTIDTEDTGDSVELSARERRCKLFQVNLPCVAP